MKYSWTILLLCLLLVGCTEPSESPAPTKESETSSTENSPESSEAKTDSESKTSSTDPKEPVKSEALVAFEAAEKKFMDERNAFIKELRALPEDERGDFIENNAPKPDAHAGTFMQIAEDHPDDPAAVDALMWIAQSRVGGDIEKTAFDVLMENHVDSDKLGDLCFSMMYGPPSEENTGRMKMLIEKSPHDEVKGKMTYALASHYLGNRDKIDVEESEIISLFETLKSEYGEFKIHERSPKTLAEMAESSIFELENLSIGKVAPEIEGEDISGVEFKLSDYRGKVVLLDFWGDW